MVPSAEASAREVLSRRVSELGLVRASELAGRAGPGRAGPGRAVRAAASHADPAPRGPQPERDPEPEPEPARDPERALLPVSGPLTGLLPWGGLRRGSTVSVHGSTALLLALVAEASRAGSWCALVGLPGVGLAAAGEAGLDLARTALVPRPGPRPASVVAALVDGLDVVVLGGASAWRAGDRQRLAARVRQKGAVLVPVGAWPGADVELHATGGTWSGLLGDGAGRLRSRRVHLRCAARGRARDHREDVLLPGPDGRVAGVAGSEGAIAELPADLPARTG
ncbi:MAG TPA: hypothetical protein VGH76_04950 [Actinomycetospora sp.]|uniref:hypothetical protein n=1 Tax=Actinomycetospora sp. TaxID=1872135 RepID=UPI002F3E3A36